LYVYLESLLNFKNNGQIHMSTSLIPDICIDLEMILTSSQEIPVPDSPKKKKIIECL